MKLVSFKFSQLFRHLLLIGCGISMIVPLVWMFSTALKSSDRIFVYPPEWLPRRTFIRKAGSLVPVKIIRTHPGKVKISISDDVSITPVANDVSYPPVKVESAGTMLLVNQDQLSNRSDNKAEVMLVRRVDLGNTGDWRNYQFQAPCNVVRVISGTSYDVITEKDNETGKERIRTIHNVADSELVESISFNWSNFKKVWTVIPFGRYYLNSLLVAITVTLGQLLTSSMAAFAFARLHFPGRDKLFFLYLATLMIPAQVTMIPLFILMTELKLVDTYWALILPPMFSAYGTFMLRQFFLTLPHELEEAARIDGCGYWLIYWKIILPLSKPALATLGVFTFMGAWNSFVWPLIMTNSDSMRTLPVGLAAFNGQYTTEWSLLMAGSAMMILPLLAVFIFGQRFFVKGIQLGAVKG